MLKYYYLIYLAITLIIFLIHRYKGYEGKITLVGLIFGGFFMPYFMVLFLAIAFAIAIWLPSRRAYLPRYLRTIEPFKGKNDVVSSIMGISAILSKIDGRVDADEIKIIRTFIARKFSISGVELDSYKGVFDFAKNNMDALDDFTRVIRNTRNYMLSMEVAYLFVAICIVDGSISENEDVLLRKIFVDIGLGLAVYENIKRHSFSGSKRYEYNESSNTGRRARSPEPSKSRVKDYYRILGVEEGASLRTVKKAYRKLVKKYHPDEIAGEAVTDEYRDFAREQMNLINEAYDYLKEYKKE